MEPLEILQISKDAIFVLLKISLPIMLVALGVGLVISLFQALTQIQEVTLTFIPKIVAVLFVAAIAAPFMASQFDLLARLTFSKISGGF